MDSVLKALLVYFVLFLLIRLSGRRTLAELSTFDFILFLIIGGATQRALVGQDYSLINAFIVVTTLIVTDIVVGLLEGKFPLLGKLVKGVPTILVDDGQVLTNRLRWSRVSLDDIMERARVMHGLESLDQIRYAILEASGKISIIPRDKPSPAPPRRRRRRNANG
jgi:uncharacterized membrane protein YcaP (DUF421 family)